MIGLLTDREEKRKVNLLSYPSSDTYKASRWTIIMAVLASLFFGADVARADSLKILALGDSLTAGYGLGPGDGFTDQLQDRFDKTYGVGEIVIINAGVSGDTTRGGLARLDWALADAPDLVMVALGGNDMLRGLEPAETLSNLSQILETLQQQNKPVLLAGMLAAANLGQDYASEFDSIYPQLAREYDVVFYPFFLDGVALNPDLNQPDGLHPNQKGVAIMVEKLWPYIEQLVKTHQPVKKPKV